MIKWADGILEVNVTAVIVNVLTRINGFIHAEQNICALSGPDERSSGHITACVGPRIDSNDVSNKDSPARG